MPIRLLLITVSLALLATSCVPDGEQAENASQRLATMQKMSDEYQDRFGDLPSAEANDVAAWASDTERPLILIDVREDDERAVSIIPGAITKAQFEAREAPIGHARVVTYCTIGYRSGIYAAELQKDGIDAVNFKGSILAWVHAGHPVQTPTGEVTNRVHVYGKTWDLLPQGYEGIW